MNLKYVLLFAAAALASTNLLASADLAKQSGCLACHQADKKVVGPAYQDVARKYAGQKGAEAMLIKSVTEGGNGKWGQIPMPPKGGSTTVTDAEIKTLVRWILAGAK
ncbi:MAG TPA: c-type cytochrome [Rhodocyclaceae bacterium]|nr:c-type cytochrome [Rhodocyclaceae bacterium]